MTPAQLLQGVQGRFSVLLVEPDQQRQLLIDALGQYQDLAGVTKTVRIASRQPTRPIPPDFLAVCGTTDAIGDFIPATEEFDEDGKRQLCFEERAVYPLRFMYLVKLRDVDLETYELPDSAVGMIQDYLEVLISIPNDERMSRIQEAGRLDISRTPTPDAGEAKLAALREAMKSQRAMMPMYTIMPY
ncbi:hypothetical protein [Aeromonas hydrophila]|uniref:hypothetical protein n=1 Tax=Aeromonas hydrophila TaxID=644 RepID=UPI003D238A3D